MDSIRVSEAPDPSSILGEATFFYKLSFSVLVYSLRKKISQSSVPKEVDTLVEK